MGKITAVFSGVLLFSALVWTFGCGKKSPRPSGTLRVIASITVLEDFVRVVGGDQVTVQSLITGL